MADSPQAAASPEKPKVAKPAKHVPLVRYQKMMMWVLVALVPASAAAVYFFGLRVLALLAVTGAVAFFVEWLFCRARGESVSMAVFVTSVLLSLVLPPTIPLWMAAVGAAFAIAFGKMVFGGFGRNVFNPALTGRVFLFVCFPVYMTAAVAWVSPMLRAPAGWAVWRAPDAVTGATPMLAYKTALRGGVGPQVDRSAYLDLLVGNRAGSTGETCGLAIIAGGLLLLATRTASWQIVASCLLGNVAVDSALHYAGLSIVPDPLFGVLSGGFLLGLFFMTTDPVSAPSTAGAKWMHGAGIGALTVVIRSFSAFAGGMMFAILLMNTFAPILDYTVRQWKAWRKAAPAGASGHG